MSNITSTNFLIIDDDEKILNELEKNLKDLGFVGKIIRAINGEDALELINAHEFMSLEKTFIICDIIMPKMNGIEFLERFRSDLDPSKKIPFLLLTSRADKELVLKAIKLGVTQYLLKPWNDQVLMQKIVECVSKH